MVESEPGAFISHPDPSHPGWNTWQLSQDGRFVAMFGKLLVRKEGERSARLRMVAPDRSHTNLHGNLHGGATLALIDVGMFAAAYLAIGPQVAGSITLDMTCQFIAAGKPGAPLDAVTEVLRETGRLVFVRGLVEQDGTLVASFTGTLRKLPRR